jgi:hypothetical protein
MAAARPRRTTLDERDLRRLTLRVPVEVHEGLLTLARTRSLSMNQLAVDALHSSCSGTAIWQPVEDWLLRTGQRYRAAVQELEEASKPDPPWWAG